ncbi:hypothetical protein GQ54DRAFT_259673 [Martensiomyces pterosporus]|nr:hypothetical protein GQ54DRAFT_259673 [Martensiomyces pterosporus]
MDQLLDYVFSFDEGGELETAKLLPLLHDAYNSPDGGLMNETAFVQGTEFFGQMDTIGVKDFMQFLEMLMPSLRSAEESRVQEAVPSNTEDGGAGVAESQRVPESAARPRLGVTTTPLDTRRRTHTPLARRYPPTSTAEGSKLRHRNIAAMTNDEFDAVANSIQPSLVNTLAEFAAHSGLTPMRNTHKSPGHQGTEQSGFSTPHVSRRALRQRLHSLSRVSPAAPLHDVPGSPTSPHRDTFSPLLKSLSPTRMGDMDSSRKHIEELLSKKAELQKLVTEKERRLELIEDQHEKTAMALERELDECKAELTMKKRDIEKLKQSENNYIESLKVAEEQVELMALNLSNSTAQSSELKRQLESKATQVTEATSHLFEHQAEIVSLKASLNANYQQQELLSKEYSKLELQYMELKQELQVAREYKDEVEAANRENSSLKETIENLRMELMEARIQQQPSTEHNANEPSGANGGRTRGNRKYKSLQDELAQNGAQDLSGVDDMVYNSREKSAGLRGERTLRHSGCQTASSLLRPTSKGVGTTADDEQRMNDDAVRQWITKVMSRCSSEDLVVLNEVWKRIDYCDASTENQEKLRHELLSVFMAPYKYGLKEAIRSRCNATLTRIVDNVSGESMGMRMSAGHQYGSKAMATMGKGAPGIAQVVANGQHTTAVIILYSVVVFCLGIITASYLNIGQPLSSTLPFGLSNSTMATAVKDTSGDGGMNLVRQILVVDDTPASNFYPPLRKRAPRSRFGEIMFYWMETLLWDDADAQIPT